MKTMRARREFWVEHVQAWPASRLTQVAYCQQHELKPKALAYWIRRHKQATSPLTLVPLAVQGPQSAGSCCCNMPAAGSWHCRLASMRPGWPGCCGGWLDTDAGTGLASGRTGRYALGDRRAFGTHSAGTRAPTLRWHGLCFRNRRGSRLKLLHWDGTGVWLSQRRLHQGHNDPNPTVGRDRQISANSGQSVASGRKRLSQQTVQVR